jgi:hypothetical protein
MQKIPRFFIIFIASYFLINIIVIMLLHANIQQDIYSFGNPANGKEQEALAPYIPTPLPL